MAAEAYSFATDQPAVVTGGGSGIGRALVQALAARGLKRIIVADRDAAAAVATADLVGEAAAPLTLDVADRAAVATAVAAIESAYGPIGAWFSNAGVHSGPGLGSPADWDRALSVNLLSHVHAADIVLRGMERRGGGLFVITASAAGLLTDLRTATYTASKHAAVGLAEWLAAGAADNVTVHCACPEGVLTGMTRPDSARAATGISFLSAEEVARSILAGVDAGTFLILTHPTTAEFERRRATERERWIAGMRRARRNTLELDRIFPPEAGS